MIRLTSRLLVLNPRMAPPGHPSVKWLAKWRRPVPKILPTHRRDLGCGEFLLESDVAFKRVRPKKWTGKVKRWCVNRQYLAKCLPMNLDSQSIPARVKIVNGIFIGGRNPGIPLNTVLEWVISCEVANFPDRNITNISCNIPADLFGMLLPLVFFGNCGWNVSISAR